MKIRPAVISFAISIALSSVCNAQPNPKPANATSAVVASFLDQDAIDEFILTVVPTFIGEGIRSLHRVIVRSRCGCYLCNDLRTALFNFITTCGNRVSKASHAPDRRSPFGQRC